MKLYGYWRSSATWRARIALELKGVDYEYIPVHLLEGGGQQHADAYRAKNPMRQVPTLEWDEDGAERRLGQSLAICRYLDQIRPEPPLVPADPYLGAKAWQLAEIVNAGIQPLQNLAVMKRLKALGVDPHAWCREHIERGFVALEAEMKQTAGRHAVGDAPSVADLCLVPQLYNGRRFEVDLSPFPTLLAVEKSCETLPAFQKAHPDVQPDARSDS